MYSSELTYQIAITLIPGVGNALAKNLIAYLGSPEAVFREKQQNLAKIPGIGEVLSRNIVQQKVLEKAGKEIEFIQKNAIKTYYFAEKNYPFRLKECPDAPILLFSSDEVDLNSGKFISVVGTRNATDVGKENCRNLIEGLAKTGYAPFIVSGLAYGVDIFAHKMALDNELPTVAVLGHGLDRIYPAMHKTVAQKIKDGKGALLTEYLSGTTPDKPNFVQRNRIIAGLCDALIVVESGIKGGSLITADLANDYNRDVFAFPGRVDDEYAAGCNMLIKTNRAALIESCDDLLRYMRWEKRETASSGIMPSLFEDLSEEEMELIDTMKKYADGIHVNELSIQLAKPYSKVSSLLLNLEFGGFIKSLPGGIYKLIR